MAALLLLETAILIAALSASCYFYAKHRNRKKNAGYYPQGNVLSAHFLMNALDVLPRTIEKDSHQAVQYSKTLSTVLRHYIKYANQPSISLQQELDLLEKYFCLLQEIHNTGIELYINIPSSITTELKDYRITPMSIQLAVENAVKHNLPNKGCTLSIKINVTETGVSITNNKSHLQKIAFESPSGLGLKYLKSKTMVVMQKPLQIEESKNVYSIHFPITKQTSPDEYSFDRRQPTISQGVDRKTVAV